MLYGRSDEQAALEALVGGARDGVSGVLVLRGEAGIGKTALLEDSVARAAGMRVLRGVGIESESELAFAGLHLLLGAFMHRFDTLPAPQANSLRAAFGMTDAAPSDRFLSGLATLSLLGELAEEQPLLVVVDDAHWLDQASAEALLFAARRLDAEPIALIFAARDGHSFAAPGLPELHLGGLDNMAGTALLAEHADDLNPHVRERILAEARGNPLALLELPGALTVAQRTGSMPANAFEAAMPISERIEQTFLGRARALPESAQTMLVIAAAEATGDLSVVVKCGATVQDLLVAEESRLIKVTGNKLVFTHPLTRSAVYHGAPAAKRLSAHRALAEVTEADQRAWHLAAAAVGPDETIAAELERTAELAHTRGGHLAVSAAYERAAGLSTDQTQRGRRLAAAALAAESAGELQRAVDLADLAGPNVDPMTAAELARIRAVVLHARSHHRAGRTMLVDAAVAVAPHSPDTAAFMFLDAMHTAWAVGDVDLIADTSARLTALALAPPEHVPRLLDAIVGLADIAIGRADRGMPAVRALFDDLARYEQSLDLRQRMSILGWSYLIGDPCATNELSLALELDCRRSDAIGLLPSALFLRARDLFMLGRPRDAEAATIEAFGIAKATSQEPLARNLLGLLAVLAAMEGAEDLCHQLIREIGSHGVPINPSSSGWALSLLDLVSGRHNEALRRLKEMSAVSHPCFALYTLPDYIEAAVRFGRSAQAELALGWFRSWAEATEQPWPNAVALRCRALLASEDQAGELYAQAVRLHRRAQRPFEQARTELLYGEWLRRKLIRSDARPHLRSALEIFERLGTAPWAERARVELRAAGESTSQDGAADLLDQLTPQELQVVRLAATGLSNRDIAAQMFLSPRTVAYHLYKAYPKLGIASRSDLVRLKL